MSRPTRVTSSGCRSVTRTAEHRVLGGPLAQHLDLVAGPFVGLFDSVRVDPAVLDQHFQGDPADLPADRVEAGQQHGFGGVVDDDVDPGDGFEGPDVAALTADDPSFDLVRGQVHHGDDGLRGLVRCDPLDRVRDDCPGPLLGGILRFRLDAPDHHRRVPADRFLLSGQQLGTRGLGGQTGDSDEFRLLGRCGGAQLLLAAVQLLGTVLQFGGIGCQCLGAGLQVALGIRQFALLGPDPSPVGHQRLLLVGECLGGRTQPLLRLLEFLAVLRQRSGCLQGDAVALGLEPGTEFGRLGPRCGDGAFRLRPGIRPDLVRVPSRALLQFVGGF